MRSVADTLREDTDAVVARRTPAERVRLAHRLGDANLALFQQANGLDTATARRRLEGERQTGRQLSRCVQDLLT